MEVSWHLPTEFLEHWIRPIEVISNISVLRQLLSETLTFRGLDDTGVESARPSSFSVSKLKSEGVSLIKV